MHRDKGIRDSKGMYCLHGHLPHLFTLGGGGGGGGATSPESYMQPSILNW